MKEIKMRSKLLSGLTRSITNGKMREGLFWALSADSYWHYSDNQFAEVHSELLAEIKDHTKREADHGRT